MTNRRGRPHWPSRAILSAGEGRAPHLVCRGTRTPQLHPMGASSTDEDYSSVGAVALHPSGRVSIPSSSSSSDDENSYTSHHRHAASVFSLLTSGSLINFACYESHDSLCAATSFFITASQSHHLVSLHAAIVAQTIANPRPRSLSSLPKPHPCLRC